MPISIEYMRLFMFVEEILDNRFGFCYVTSLSIFLT